MRKVINGLLNVLTDLDAEPSVKERYRQRLILLLGDVKSSRPHDSLLPSKIRDISGDIDGLKERLKNRA
jgi:hypothetical protein